MHVSNDGLDSEPNGVCDLGDADGDGVINSTDTSPTDPNVCADADTDGCDDCALTGADGSGGDVANDGPDTDGDGIVEQIDSGNGFGSCLDSDGD